MPRQHLRMNAQDNVTTLIDAAVTDLRLSDGTHLAAGIPFGHKAALAPIARGAPVVKYGVVIGHATQDIGAGEHVHVHNCR